jgi:intracellular multiplication protein IcmE
MQQVMATQAQSLVASWQPSKMAHIAGSYAAEKAQADKEKAAQLAKELSEKGAKTAKPLIKAGTILFGILDTAVDSDYPDTPVLVTIVQDGSFKGAKLMGKLNLVSGKDKVSLNFTLMDKEEWDTTKTVTAFAIDPDTARTVMATSVDSHYLYRYGSIMATSFLTGYANSILNEGTSTTGIFGTSTTHASLSPGNKLAVGLGQIGTTLSAAMANNINTPNTVKVKAGVGLGVLFMADVLK